MNVRELISRLNKYDPDMEVLAYSEDESLLKSGRGFIVFHVQDVADTQGEMTRLKDNTPSMKFGRSPSSKDYVTLDITAEF